MGGNIARPAWSSNSNASMSFFGFIVSLSYKKSLQWLGVAEVDLTDLGLGDVLFQHE